MKARNGEIIVTIRLPYWAYAGLKEQAKVEYRSAHSQIVKTLLDSLASKGITAPEESPPADTSNPWG